MPSPASSSMLDEAPGNDSPVPRQTWGMERSGRALRASCTRNAEPVRRPLDSIFARSAVNISASRWAVESAPSAVYQTPSIKKASHASQSPVRRTRSRRLYFGDPLRHLCLHFQSALHICTHQARQILGHLLGDPAGVAPRTQRIDGHGAVEAGDLLGRRGSRMFATFLLSILTGGWRRWGRRVHAGSCAAVPYTPGLCVKNHLPKGPPSCHGLPVVAPASLRQMERSRGT